MPFIRIHQDKATDKAALTGVCPFGAIEISGGDLAIGAGCRMCRQCVRKHGDVFEFVDDSAPGVDKSLWRGIAVVAEIEDDALHPVSLELLGKARELAAKINHPVYAVVLGANAAAAAEKLLRHGADEVFLYDDPALAFFRIEPYAALLEDFINRVHPSSVLVGGTPNGRSLAPRVAARFRTGLTADCTKLDISESTDLDQIRPAYGGNIMAHINTPRTRPQFATVRYKVFSAPPACEPHGKVTRCAIPSGALDSRIEIVSRVKKPPEEGIENADILVVAGRGVKKPEDLALLRDLADALGGRLASTRAVVEAGWIDPRFQIGLSGRTVKPKLIITCGVSGAIQFVAGMQNAGCIIAINTDPAASIFKVAHVRIVGDLYAVVPEMTRLLRACADEGNAECRMQNAEFRMRKEA